MATAPMTPYRRAASITGMKTSWRIGVPGSNVKT